MLETIIVILVILWLLGFFVVKIGALIHILLVIALVVLILRIIKAPIRR
ncbi:MAG TPA: lmo0937 family membrane protein [Fimbriimonas sp.]|nr:lmo0937 family membrane protein [Fimbriimonas sp.]